MGNIRRTFMGKNDPDRISLENVFPLGDLTFSMPFGVEQGRHHRIVVEGNPEFLRCFGDCAGTLLESESDPLGRWVALTTFLSEPRLELSCLELVYEPRCTKELRALRLLVFVLRTDLVRICNLRLSPVSLITGTKDFITFLNRPVPLPDYIKNGFLDVAPPIVLPPQRVN